MKKYYQILTLLTFIIHLPSQALMNNFKHEVNSCNLSPKYSIMKSIWDGFEIKIESYLFYKTDKNNWCKHNLSDESIQIIREPEFENKAHISPSNWFKLYFEKDKINYVIENREIWKQQHKEKYKIDITTAIAHEIFHYSFQFRNGLRPPLRILKKPGGFAIKRKDVKNKEQKIYFALMIRRLADYILSNDRKYLSNAFYWYNLQKKKDAELFLELEETEAVESPAAYFHSKYQESKNENFLKDYLKTIKLNKLLNNNIHQYSYIYGILAGHILDNKKINWKSDLYNFKIILEILFENQIELKDLDGHKKIKSLDIRL